MERFIPLVEDPDTKGGDHVRRVAFSPDGKVVLSGSDKTGITAWEVTSGKKIWNAPQTGHLLAYNPKGRWIVCGGGYTDPPIWLTVLDPKTGNVLRRLEVVAGENQDPQVIYGPSYVTDLLFTPDGSRLITAHHPGSVRSWDPTTGTELIRMAGNGYGATGLSVSPDSKWVAVGCGRKIL